MKRHYLKGIFAAQLGILALAGCSQEEITNTSDTGTSPEPAPLTVTVVQKDGKSSRVAFDDENGKYMSADGLLAVKKMTWEAGDTIWAYSPDWTNGKATGGYTTLVIDKYDEYTENATFRAVNLNKYAAGKPLYIYYHGGETKESYGAGQQEVVLRPTRKPEYPETQFAMGAGLKSLKRNALYLTMGYVAEAPADGNITCTLEGRSPLLCFILPFGKGLPADAARALDGKITYEVKVAALRNNKLGFPTRYSMKFDTAGGQLSATWEKGTDATYGDPLQYTITNVGLAGGRSDESLLAGNGRVYLTLPAIEYTGLRMEVTMTVKDADAALVAKYFPGLDVANGVTFKWLASSDAKQELEFDPNNEGKHKANMVYTAGKTGEVMIFGSDGVYQSPGNGWTIIDESTIN